MPAITRELLRALPEGRAALPPRRVGAADDDARAGAGVRRDDAGRRRGRAARAHGGQGCAQSRGVPRAVRDHALGNAAGGGDRAHRVRAGGGCGARRRPVPRGCVTRRCCNVRDGLSLDEAVEAPLRGLARAERDARHRRAASSSAGSGSSSPRSRSISRSSPSPTAIAGVVGFDLAGGERGHPALVHAEAFAYARQHDLAVHGARRARAMARNRFDRPFTRAARTDSATRRGSSRMNRSRAT